VVDEVTLTLIGTWILVIGTLFFMFWQTRQAHLLNSANAVLELRSQFESPDIRRARRELAEFFLRDTSDGMPPVEMLTFYELLGIMVRRGLLDRQLVWNAFGSYVTITHYRMRHPADRLGRLRKDFGDPLAFSQFEWLAGEVLRIDAKRLGPGQQELIDPADEARAIFTVEAQIRAE
jgi:hypothetical protein